MEYILLVRTIFCSCKLNSIDLVVVGEHLDHEGFAFKRIPIMVFLPAVIKCDSSLIQPTLSCIYNEQQKVLRTSKIKHFQEGKWKNILKEKNMNEAGVVCISADWTHTSGKTKNPKIEL